MFMLKSLGRLILGNSEQKELFALPSGAFWTAESKKNVVNRIRMYAMTVCY